MCGISMDVSLFLLPFCCGNQDVNKAKYVEASRTAAGQSNSFSSSEISVGVALE